MDLLPTFAQLAGLELSQQVDARDIWPLMSDPEAKSPHQAFFYYCKDALHAVRAGPGKLHLALPEGAPSFRGDVDRAKPRLFNLAKDPESVARLQGLADDARADLAISVAPAGISARRDT